MTDGRSQRGEHEVRCWTQRFGVSRDRLQKAVDKVGTGVTAVEEELAA